MEIERFFDKFGPNWSPPRKLNPKEREDLKKRIGPIWEGYKKLPLTLKVEDKGVKRLCEVLTLSGFNTYSSCNGHGKEVPHIYFHTRKNSLVARLAYKIQKTAITTFRWGIRAFGSPGQNSMKLTYSLMPFSLRDNKGEDSHELLLEDFDILGYTIFDEFLNDHKR